MKEILLYTVLVMILYDLTLHIADMLIDFKITKRKHPFGVGKLLNWYAKDDKEKRIKFYDLFWTIYWFIALLLLVIYFLR